VSALPGGIRFAAPTHPIFVHFTIGLSGASFAFDLLQRVTGARSLLDAAWWTLAVATAATVLTLVSGVASRLRLPMEEGEARSFLRAHMALGPVFFGLLLGLTVWRAVLWEGGRPASAAYLLTAAVAAVVMTVQGYLGGELVYRHGAEVETLFPRLPGAPPGS
jgi:uncharacterized membrane protein